LAEEAGVPTPTAEDARRLDRKRKGKKTSNREWVSRTDRDARIAKLKDGRTRLAYKPEHVVDLETGAIVAAVVHGADIADPASLELSLGQAEANLQAARGGDSEAASAADPEPTSTEDDPPSDGSRPRGKVVADKGYHKATLLRRLKTQRYRTYIPERRQAGRRRWTDKGGTPTAVAFHQNRARGLRPLGKRYHLSVAGAPSGWNAPSPTSARRVAPAGPDCAGGRTWRSAPGCRPPGRISPS
jgi:hypothetical protein